MITSKTIFGFGSLISKASLLTTAPNATDIKPAYIKGFIRSFSHWDAIGYTETNLDVAGEPMCALDIAETNDAEARVNGVVFTVSEPDLSKLLEREDGYELLTATAYNYITGKPIIEDCLVFSAGKHDGKYDFNSQAQQRYLDIFIEAAKQYGELFYQEVLDTTFVGAQKLRELNKLVD